MLPFPPLGAVPQVKEPQRAHVCVQPVWLCARRRTGRDPQAVTRAGLATPGHPVLGAQPPPVSLLPPPPRLARPGSVGAPAKCGRTRGWATDATVCSPRKHGARQGGRPVGAGKGAFPTRPLESWTVMILSGEGWLLSLPLALRKPQFPQNDGRGHWGAEAVSPHVPHSIPGSVSSGGEVTSCLALLWLRFQQPLSCLLCKPPKAGSSGPL